MGPYAEVAVRIAAIVVALLVSLFALSGVTESLRAEPDAPPPAAAANSPATEEPPDALHFAVSNLRLPSDSPETRCVMALGRNQPDECKQIALAALPTAEEPSLGRLRYLLARATINDPSTSRPVLETLAASSHSLSAIALVRLSEMLRDSDPRAALTATDTLLRDERWKNRLLPLRAVLLNRLGRSSEGEALLRELVAQAPANTSGAPATVALAAVLANKKDVASRKQALALYRRVYTRTPLSTTGEQAKREAQQVLASLPKNERVSLTFAESLTEADSLASSRAYERAIRAYRELEKRAGKDADQACAARLGQGKVLFSMRKSGEAASVLTRAASDCKNAELKANAHFQAARAIVRQGDAARAIGHYESCAKASPDAKLADDALFAASQAYLDLDDEAGARRSLSEVLNRESKGEARSNARFAMAWLDRQSGDFDAALGQLSQLLAEGTNEASEDIHGRAAYWHARTLLDQGQKSAASAEFIELFRKRPLAYYSQQAMARLQEFDPRSVKMLVEELRDIAPKRGVWLTVQPELRTHEFERAVELLRCGEPSRAQEELNALGVFERKASDQLYLLGSALLQQFGAQSQATTLARRRVGSIMQTPPKGDARGLWRIAYPQAYAPLIDDVARNAGVPASFVRAVAREESSFDPGAVSPANAYGLIQVITSTAKAYARPMGLPYDPGSLKTPEVNLRIGTSFMRELFSKYAQNPAIVPAAYNAGSGAADRWLRERPTMALDEWIESIPYTETRRYTRRVLQTYGVYSWLDDAQIPTMRARLPNSQQPTTSPNEPITLR